jgi:hypothetical protein
MMAILLLAMGVLPIAYLLMLAGCASEVTLLQLMCVLSEQLGTNKIMPRILKYESLGEVIV